MVLCLAFTGACRTEIEQLLRSDVQLIDGVRCFSLIESDDEAGDLKKELKMRRVAGSSRCIVS
jgi:hypothetical protein